MALAARRRAAGRVAAETLRGRPTFKEATSSLRTSLRAIKNFLPTEFGQRDFSSTKGMKMEVGPFFKDYGKAPEYLAASEKFKGQARSARMRASKLSSDVPFDPGSSTARAIPRPGVKHIWKLRLPVEGDGSDSRTSTRTGSRRRTTSLLRGTAKTSCCRTARTGVRREAERRPVPWREANQRVRDRSRRARSTPAAFLLMSYRTRTRRSRAPTQERRQPGLCADAAPRAPHLDAQRTDRGIRHRLHLRRSPLLRRHRSTVTPGAVSARWTSSRPSTRRVNAYPYAKDHNFASLRPLRTPTTAGSCATR